MIDDAIASYVERYEAWEEADPEVLAGLKRLVHVANEYETIQGLVPVHRLEELQGLKDAADTVRAIELALGLLSGARKLFDQHQAVALFESPTALADLSAMLRRNDELDVFRALVVGVVKKAGALAKDKQPGDNELVALLEMLMP